MSLVIDCLCVEIAGRTILDDVSFEVPSGKTAAVVGPSGVGKSTLLRAVAGIVRPDAGTISIDGIDVAAVPVHERRVGMVFQDDQLFPHLNVADNVAFGLDPTRSLLSEFLASRSTKRERRRSRADRIGEMLDLVGLTGFEQRRVQGLSGGEAKRVALARALAPTPAVLLLDEPLTGLDRELHDRLMADLGAILSSTNTTAILVTHDIVEAEFLADRIIRLDPAPLRPSTDDPNG